MIGTFDRNSQLFAATASDPGHEKALAFLVAALERPRWILVWAFALSYALPASARDGLRGVDLREG